MRVPGEPKVERIRIGNPLDDTAVRAVGDGVYAGDIPESWVIGMVHGGTAMMAALQASRQAVRERGRFLTGANAVFSRALPAGPFEVKTRVLREARAASFVSADLRVAGSSDVALRVQGVFGEEVNQEGPPAIGRVFPSDIRSREDSDGCPHPTTGPFGEIMGALPFIRQQERRLAFGIPPDDPAFERREARVAVWTRFRRSPVNANGVLDPTAYASLGDDNMAYLQHAGAEGLARVMITLQLDLQCFATTLSEWVLMHSRIRHADQRHLQSEVELWAPEGVLLAVAAQRALLK